MRVRVWTQVREQGRGGCWGGAARRAGYRALMHNANEAVILQSARTLNRMTMASARNPENEAVLLTVCSSAAAGALHVSKLYRVT